MVLKSTDDALAINTTLPACFRFWCVAGDTVNGIMTGLLHCLRAWHIGYQCLDNLLGRLVGVGYGIELEQVLQFREASEDIGNLLFAQLHVEPDSQ